MDCCFPLNVSKQHVVNQSGFGNNSAGVSSMLVWSKFSHHNSVVQIILLNWVIYGNFSSLMFHVTIINISICLKNIFRPHQLNTFPMLPLLVCWLFNYQTAFQSWTNRSICCRIRAHPYFCMNRVILKFVRISFACYYVY